VYLPALRSPNELNPGILKQFSLAGILCEIRVDRRNGNDSMDKLYERKQIVDSRNYRLVNLALTPGRILDRFIEQVVCVLLEKRKM